MNILYVGERESFFSREIVRGFFSMRSEGCDWNFSCLPKDLSLSELANCLKTKKVDGILARGLSLDLAQYINSLSIPSVFIRSTEDSMVEYINGPHPDDRAIGKLAGNEFNYLHLGYWGFVHWEGVMWSEARKKTFHSYATSIGVSNDTLALPPEARGNWTGVQKIAQWLEALPKPCGVLACKDEVGLEVLQACELLGVSVPDEVAVIGVDNDQLMCESSSPSLSSIDLKADAVGRSAVVQLAKLLGVLDKGGDVEPCVAVLVRRGSSHRKDKCSLIYQKAMDVIGAKPLVGMNVDTLARSCGVSRRGLERVFEKYEQGSPAAIVRKRRVVAIVSILKSNSTSIESIAHQAGFSDPAGLSNFVKRMTGKTPGELRAR